MKKIKLIAIILLSFCYSGLIVAQGNIDEAKKLTTREQYAQAEEMFKKLMVSDPGLGDVYYYYGENEIKALFSDTITRSLAETIINCKKLFDKGIEKDPQNPLNYIGLARLDYISGKKGKVSENVAKANTMIPAMTIKIKKIEDPKRYAVVLTEMAKIFILQGKTDTASALPLLRRAALVDPQNPEVFNTTGDAYLEIKDANNAMLNYNASQSVAPNSPLAKYRIGYLYIRAGNPSASISSLEEAIKIDPNFAPAYKELGYVYRLVGKPDKSKQNYSKYLELSGNNIPAKIAYVISLFKTKDYKECISQINQIFAVDSSINSMNRVIGYSYFEIKDFVKAQYYLNKFLKNIGNDDSKIITTDYVYLGRILGERGMVDQADEKLRMAIKVEPTNTYLYSEIALYQSKALNYKKAIAALDDKKAAKAFKNVDYYSLGKFYFSDTNYEKAEETLNTFLNLNDPKVKQYEMYALTYLGYAQVTIDSLFETGRAKPTYEKIIEKSLVDTVKFSKNLVEGYSYLASYYFINKAEKDNGKAKKYYLKVLAIDPNNAAALRAMTHPDIQKAKLPEE